MIVIDDKHKRVFDPNDLYREETYTDMNTGSIRKMIPVNPDGAADGARPILFMGTSEMMTPQGPMPINFFIHVETLEEAVMKYSEFEQRAVREIIDELNKMEQQESSRIVVPGIEALK